MKKLQQFYIMKLSSSRLDKFGYKLKRVIGNGGNTNIRDIRKNNELIALADNQALRTIRSIRYKRYPNVVRYSPDSLNDLYTRKKEIIRKMKTFSSPENKKELAKVNSEIDGMLFMPEYVSVVIDDNQHYKKIIRDGFFINSFKYVRLMCSAGQARVNTVIFIREDFEKEVKEKLKCGAKNVKITKNKYNAYFALSSSATYLIPHPNVCLIDDCEIEMTKKVDWVSKIPPEEKTQLSNNERVTTEEKTLSFNLFDGCGATSVEFVQKVAMSLEINYIPSAFCIRCAYVKGMVFVVDFKQYAKENGISEIVDLYGNTQKVEDIDIILTKSQFKLWNAYDSIEQYNKLCEENDFKWGVTKVTPEKDSLYFRSNYQFCQVLDLRDNKNVARLCNPTVEWLKGIAADDPYKSLLFLLGNLLEKDIDPNNILNETSDNVAKALILNNAMIKDEYIKNTIIYSINKKIRESYLGKLILDGNFSVMIPDMYAFMQHAFGQEVTGALKEFEHYSYFWNQKNVSDVVAMRSPLTWRSEVNRLHLKHNDLTEKWFKYLKSGIVYNVWGCDCIIHADSDFDGDIVATTNNPVFLECRYDNLPITYTKSTVDKEYIKEQDLYKADLQSFDTKIGQITNISTAFTDLLSAYEDQPGHEKETAEILERLKLIRKSQGDAIDKAKGIRVEPMPKHWTRRINEVPEGETQEHLDFCNSIVVDRKPYFFRYLYPVENTKYRKYIENASEFTLQHFDKDVKELLDSDIADLSEEEKEYLEEFKKHMPLMDYNGRMNKICHYMEDSLKELKIQSRDKTPDDIICLMMSDPNREIYEVDIDTMSEFYKKYKLAKKKFKSAAKQGKESVGGLAAANFDQYCSILREDIIATFSNELDYVTDLAIYIAYKVCPSRSKDFVWDLFGNQIIEHLKVKRQEHVYLPVHDESGTINYLGGKYKLQEIEI